MSRGPEKDAELDTDLEELDRKAKERKIQKQRAKQKEDEEKAEATRYAREARRMRERAERAEKALDGIQCKGTTLKGLRCRNPPSRTRTSNLHCHLHQPDYERWSCKGTTLRGTRCRLPPSKTREHREYCHHHQHQAPFIVSDSNSESESESEYESSVFASRIPPVRIRASAAVRAGSSIRKAPLDTVRPIRTTPLCTTGARRPPTPIQETPTRPRSARPSTESASASDRRECASNPTPQSTKTPATSSIDPIPQRDESRSPSTSSRVAPSTFGPDPLTPKAIPQAKARKAFVCDSPDDDDSPSPPPAFRQGPLTPPETPPQNHGHDFTPNSPSTPSPSMISPEVHESIATLLKTVPLHLHSNRRRLADYLANLVIPNTSPKPGYIYAFKIESQPTSSTPGPITPPKYALIDRRAGQIHVHSLVNILREESSDGDDFWASPRPRKQTVRIKIGRSVDATLGWGSGCPNASTSA